MSREIEAITDSNDPDTHLMLAGIHEETCESLKILRQLRDTLEDFRPLLEAFKGTNGGTIGLGKARKALRDVRNG